MSWLFDFFSNLISSAISLSLILTIPTYLPKLNHLFYSFHRSNVRILRRSNFDISSPQDRLVGSSRKCSRSVPGRNVSPTKLYGDVVIPERVLWLRSEARMIGIHRRLRCARLTKLIYPQFGKLDRSK